MVEIAVSSYSCTVTYYYIHIKECKFESMQSVAGVVYTPLTVHASVSDRSC